MNKLANAITNILAENGFIKSEDYAACQYGMEVFLISAAEIGCILFASIFLKNSIETILWLATFIPKNADEGTVLSYCQRGKGIRRQNRPLVCLIYLIKNHVPYLRWRVYDEKTNINAMRIILVHDFGDCRGAG